MDRPRPGALGLPEGLPVSLRAALGRLLVTWGHQLVSPRPLNPPPAPGSLEGTTELAKAIEALGWSARMPAWPVEGSPLTAVAYYKRSTTTVIIGVHSPELGYQAWFITPLGLVQGRGETAAEAVYSGWLRLFDVGARTL